jgi:hypothetical protein
VATWSLRRREPGALDPEPTLIEARGCSPVGVADPAVGWLDPSRALGDGRDEADSRRPKEGTDR